jgi:hypothetical protein
MVGIQVSGAREGSYFDPHSGATICQVGDCFWNCSGSGLGLILGLTLGLTLT